MTVVIEVARGYARSASARTAVAVTWLTDFNDIDATGQIIAEPAGTAAPHMTVGRVVQLSDGEHFCQAVITRVRDSYILARPNWDTWQRAADVVIDQPTLTYRGNFSTAPSTA